MAKKVTQNETTPLRHKTKRPLCVNPFASKRNDPNAAK